MKQKITTVFLLIIICLTGFNVYSYSRTKGYVKKNGVYVAPHYQTKPDRSKINNWSTKSNINPYTGKRGNKSSYILKKKPKGSYQ